MDVPTTFAARLNLLFEAIVPPGGREYLSAEVVERLQACGAAMSAPYLSQLRNGVRTWPSAHTIDAIASFFGVSPDFFTDESHYRRVADELRLNVAAREPLTRRILERTVGLSEAALDDIDAYIDVLERRLDASVRSDDTCPTHSTHPHESKVRGSAAESSA
jgi:transcriptional regulator with XRE-family HTH domain